MTKPMGYARVQRAIWRDPTFTALTMQAQWLYLRLLSDPRIEVTGLTDWRPDKIARSSYEWDIQTVLTAAKELTDAHFVVVDDELEEVLIRTFVRHDGLMSQPNMVRRLAKMVDLIESQTLRDALLVELRRLRDEQPQHRWDLLGEVLDEQP